MWTSHRLRPTMTTWCNSPATRCSIGSTLSLAGTRITDRGVAVLDAHPWLSYLDLSHTSVTDRGLASMSRCYPNTLKLSGTRVTDATLQLIEQQAERLPNRSIDLTDTQVTEERVRELGKSHWMMNIAYGSSKYAETYAMNRALPGL